MGDALSWVVPILLIGCGLLALRTGRLMGANRNLVARSRELELAAQVFEQSPQSVVITDPNGIILKVNRYFTELTGYTAQEAVGQTPRLLKSQRHDDGFYAEMWRCLKEEGKWRGEIWNRKKNGDGFAALLSISSVRDGAGRITHYIATTEDITEQKICSERVYHLAHFDVLTNLPNRRLFNDRLHLAIQHARRYGLGFAVLFLDLDNFKRINDTMGHQAGDVLLQVVAQRLQDSLRSVDSVARFGGDEFAVMLEEVRDPADAKRVAEKMIEAVSTPLELEGVTVQIGVSIGVSMFPADANNLEELFRNADTAMYQAKSTGKNRCQFFSQEMTLEATRRLEMENELKVAIPEQFYLLYQPQKDLSSGRVTGAEALVRWRHPQRGIVLPDDFTRIAEESGQLGRLWSWVLQTACRHAGAWRREDGSAVRVGINIPALQLNEPGFVDTIEKLLCEIGLEPWLLELEISESAVLHRFEESVAALRRLRGIGVRVALDGFGTGNTSIGHLRRLPLDRIKIDRSFVCDLEKNAAHLALVRMILAAASTWGIEVVAVGVENELQLDILREEGCGAYQGYLLAVPLSPEELERFVRPAQVGSPALRGSSCLPEPEAPAAKLSGG